MAEAPKKPERTTSGTFAKGSSGNPGGKRRLDVVEKAKQFRRDGWQNFFSGHGVFGRDKRQGTSFRAQALSFDQLAELWRGDDLAARAVETLPYEALRQGYDLQIQENQEDGEGETEADRVAEVVDKLETLGADQLIRSALETERGMGGAAILVGANDREADLTRPLNLDRVASLDWLTHLEPREIVPVYGYADPRAPKYGQPEIFRLTSRAILPPRDGRLSSGVMDVHESRLLIFPGIRVSRFQALAAQGGWGDSVLVRMWRVLRDFNLAWGSAGTLVTTFASAVYKMKDLWEMLSSADGDAAFQERLAAMDLAMSTINATVIDATDDYKREQTPISGLPELMDKFATRLAAAADMPITRLFGTSPGGLNATGESDVRFFYDHVAAYQAHRVEPALRQLVQIIFRTTGTKVEPEKWSIRFRPLWQESAKDRAAAMLTSAQADHIWVTDGVLSAEEVTDSHWGTGEWSPEIRVDVDAREKQEQATASPVKNPEDLAAIGRLRAGGPGAPPGSQTPAPGAAPSGSTNPGATQTPQPIRADRSAPVYREDDWSEDLHPRDQAGKFSAAFSTRMNEIGETRHRVTFEHPATETRQTREFKTRPGAERWVARRAREQEAKVTASDARILAARAQKPDEAGSRGLTYDPRSASFPGTGYVVATHGDRERKLAGLGALDAAQVAAYIRDNHDVLARDDKAQVGAWYNKDTATWHLDVPHVEKSLDVAVRLAQDHKQLAIWDLGRKEQIDDHEYQEALDRRGRFADRVDSARRPAPPLVRSTHDHARADGRGDARVREEGASRGRRVDFDPGEDRDQNGKWTSGGSSATARAGDAWKGAAAGKKSTAEAFRQGDLWAPERRQIHQKYVEEKVSTVPKSANPTVYMTGGGTASGKTSAILRNPEAGFPDETKAAHIDADSAKDYLPEYREGVRVGDQAAAGFVHEESVQMSKIGVARAIAEGKDVVYDSTGDTGVTAMKAKVAAMRAQGVRRVVADYATLDPDEAVRRADARAATTGRAVDHDIIRALHAAACRVGSQCIKDGVFDEAKVWDTSGRSPRLVAQYDRQAGLQIRDPAGWDAFVRRGEAPLPPGWENS